MKVIFTCFISWLIILFMLTNCINDNEAKTKETSISQETLDSGILKYVVKVNGTHLRLREAPNVESRIVSKLYKGQIVYVSEAEIDQKADWIRVKPENTELTGYVSSDYIIPFSNDYYDMLINEYFPLAVGNYWMYHVENASQDWFDLKPEKLEIISKSNISYAGDEAEIYQLESENSYLITLMARLLGDNDDLGIPTEDEKVKFNSFVKYDNKIYLGIYLNKKLELGPVVFSPSITKISLFEGEGQMTYRQKNEIKLERTKGRILPIYPVAEYKYISNDLNDEFGLTSIAVFSKNVGLYELSSSSDAYAGILLCQANVKSTTLSARMSPSSESKPIDSQSMGKWLCENTFLLAEGGIQSSVRFEPLTEGYYKSGVLILNQIGCDFVYNYTISENNINCDFYESTCSRPSRNVQFIIERDRGLIKTIVNNQYFEFKLK